MNKFKVLSVAILLIFVFMIGAIYLNAKEMLKQKGGSLNRTQNENVQEEDDNANNEENDKDSEEDMDSQRPSDTALSLSVLETRVKTLEQNQSSGENIKCKIVGYYTSDGDLEHASIMESISQAKTGNDFALKCSIR